MYFLRTQIRQASEHLDRIKEEDARLNVEVRALETKKARIEMRSTQLAAELKRAQEEALRSRKKVDVGLHKKDIEELRFLAEALEDATFEVRKRHEASLVKGETLKRLLKELRHDGLLMKILGGVGCGLSTLGFMLWYRRLQRWQDAAVRAAVVSAPSCTPENR